jgi:hypothetical protein
MVFPVAFPVDKMPFLSCHLQDFFVFSFQEKFDSNMDFFGVTLFEVFSVSLFSRFMSLAKFETGFSDHISWRAFQP